MKKPNPVLSAVVLAVFAGQSVANACVNTSYSHAHEKQITGDLVEIIMGRIPSHGQTFYEAELVRTEGVLREKPADYDARVDHAVALLKLKRYERAEAELLKIATDVPGRYKTHANLGVLYKKMGRFAEAAEHTREGLKIKPEGHLGLGDYYLKMLSWRYENASTPGVAPTKNFLGLDYSKPELVATSPEVDDEYLRTMIIADRHFADAYLVLGDYQQSLGETELAYRCYLAALRLPQETEETPIAVIEQRIADIESVWEKKARKSRWKWSSSSARTKAKLQFAADEKWLEQFHRAEKRIVTLGRVSGTGQTYLPPDFDQIQAEMSAPKATYWELGPVKQPGFLKKLLNWF
ncbi:MAG: tetratricopeptide repeat protein [Verrucomicrobiales bacterium]|nr:tetratricopeptide repeat protein [Verrucomicrobiales bacterium]